jgi:hypothetical protein
MRLISNSTAAALSRNASMLRAAAVLLQAVALNASSVKQWYILCVQLGLSQQHFTGAAAAAAAAAARASSLAPQQDCCLHQQLWQKTVMKTMLFAFALGDIAAA